MNGNGNTLLTGLIVILMLGNVGFAYATDYIPHLEVTVTNTTIAAGTKGNLGVTIHNGGDYDASQIEAFTTSAVPGISVLGNSQKVINLIERGKSAFYNTTINVDQSVAVGTYTINIQLGYLRAGVGMVQVTIPVTIVVDQQFLPMIEFTAAPKKLVPGGSNYITVTIANIASSDVENIAVSFDTSSQYMAIESPMAVNIDSISAGAKTTFVVKVYMLESAPLGSYSLTASATYSSVAGNSHRQTAVLQCEVTAPVITAVPVLTVTNLNTTTTLPGEKFTIKARVSCSDAAVYNAKASISLDPTGMLRPLNPTTIPLGDMEPGETRDVTCTVLVDGSAPAAQLPTTLTISYIDSKAVQRSSTEVLTIQVGQLVDFTFTSVGQVNVEQGSTGKIDGTLILKGTSRVQFTSVEVVSQDGVQLTAESSDYLGAVYPDSATLFTVKFNALSTMQLGEATIHMRISYTDNLNVVHEKLLEYPVTILKPAPTITTDFWGWLRHVLGLG